LVDVEERLNAQIANLKAMVERLEAKENWTAFYATVVTLQRLLLEKERVKH
jgi:hypothetical protein